MISAPIKALLDTIASKEAPRGYDQIYGKAENKLGRHPVSKMTLDEVLDLQDRMKKYGSSAAGRYQFIQSTLKATMRTMGLSGKEVWTPALQDSMAYTLLEGRKLHNYLKGIISAEDFANNLSMEWASLPVVTRIQGQKRMVNPGESFYEGDGLNKSFHSPADILRLVYALKGAKLPAKPYTPAPARKPRGLLTALIELIMAVFGRKK